LVTGVSCASRQSPPRLPLARGTAESRPIAPQKRPLTPVARSFSPVVGILTDLPAPASLVYLRFAQAGALEAPIGVFYPITALPERRLPFIDLNPVSFIVFEGRKMLLFGPVPSWGGWMIYAALTLAVERGGFWWFQRLRKGFGDVA